MISEDRLQQALTLIAETDETEAMLKTDALRAEHAFKRKKDAVFLSFDHGSVKEREARANTSEIVLEAEGEWLAAVNAHREVENRRKREIMIIDVWRSLNSNKRAGMV